MNSYAGINRQVPGGDNASPRKWANIPAAPVVASGSVQIIGGGLADSHGAW